MKKIQDEIMKTAFLLTALALCACRAHAGSLSGPYNYLFSNEREYKAGDLIKVYVDENVVASQANETNLSKAAEIGGGFTAGGTYYAGSADGIMNLKSGQTGYGKAKQSGKLVGVISVAVTEVKPNGILKIKGEKTIEMNGNTQKMTLEGEVNPLDIMADNTIGSGEIYMLKVNYSGEGLLGNKSRGGILTQFLDWLWIF